jgi:hypothetical protein
MPKTAKTSLDLTRFAPEWQRAFEWVEQTTGGRLVRAERQVRWRPAWFLDVEKDGEILPLYWRGDRALEGINSVYNAEYEAAFYPILERHGIPVPHLHGLCRDPLGQLIDRMPGRHNLGTAETEAERSAVLAHYMELLARIHAIDPAEFEQAGLARPKSPRDIALGDFDLWEGEFRKAKRRPEPMWEFLIQWCRRNAPERDEVTLALSDAGQFLFDDGRITAVLDLEMGFLGDPMADLAALRTRDFAEPLGDLAAGYAHYEQVSGRALDLEALRYHTVRFNLLTPLTTAHLVADPPPELDWPLYQSWQVVWGRASLQGMAEWMGLDTPSIELPSPVSTRQSTAVDALVAQLGAAPEEGESEAQAYQRDRALRTAQALQRADRIGPALEAQDRDEVAALLGKRPTHWRDVDAELEAFVLAASPEQDETLLRFFARRNQRDYELHRPALREFEDSEMQSL